ncbi:MAG: hypothetical protein IKM88_00915 [Lachnospiraceae bacterium]|nr:hypothetical protein [Lachnospiraceae bacterium]
MMTISTTCEAIKKLTDLGREVSESAYCEDCFDYYENPYTANGRPDQILTGEELIALAQKLTAETITYLQSLKKYEFERAKSKRAGERVKYYRIQTDWIKKDLAQLQK